jgi:hypothetical protein
MQYIARLCWLSIGCDSTEKTSIQSQKEIIVMIKRIIHVVGRNGAKHLVPLTAKQAAFFLRLAEFKAKTDPRITFHEVVADWREKRGSFFSPSR